MADITYNKINFENEPSHNTPLSAENLNKMDTAIYDLVTKSNSLVPNPAESPTEGLEKLEYDGTVYEVKGGHKILNDSGSVLTQMDNMQFNGVYTHNASTITEVDIIREFSTVAEIEALTGEAQKGFQVVQDAEDYIPFTASENIFDNTNTSFTGDNVQDVLEEVDSALEDINGRIEFKAVTGTTSASGNLSLGLNTDYVILSLSNPTGGYLVSIYTYSGNYYANVRDINLAIIANTSVTVNVTYMIKPN
ncbi:MAG: hypothetical protein J6S67_15220 [Methanobrevibacter sp.]|nr:hypothetical protein [Methanobrevibacter sp.]